MANRQPKMKPLTRMLEDPNKEIHKTYGTSGLLSKLFRIMLRDLGIGGYRFSLLMEKFLNDPSNSVPANLRDRTSNRGNLNKEFSNSQMSFKVFCKALRFQQLVRFKLILEATHQDGTITVHEVGANLTNDEVPFPDDEDDANLADKPPAEDQEEIPYLDTRFDDE